MMKQLSCEIVTYKIYNRKFHVTQILSYPNKLMTKLQIKEHEKRKWLTVWQYTFKLFSTF